jgi:hypothetical protein
MGQFEDSLGLDRWVRRLWVPLYLKLYIRYKVKV